MKYLFILFYMATVAADYAVYMRYVSKLSVKTLRIAFIVFASVTDLIPLSIPSIMLFVTDNTPTVMNTVMWLFTIYIISVLPRIAFYVFLPAGGRRRITLILGTAVAVSVASYLIYGLIIGRKNIVIKETEIYSENLPKPFDGFRIVQFSDLHIGTLLNPEKETRALVEAINASHPDIVVFSGDLVTIRHSELDERRMELLSAIDGPVFATVGNHDTGIYILDSVSLPKYENSRVLLEKERALGWTVLDDTTAYIRRGCDSISVTGLSFSDELHEFRHLTDIPDFDISHGYDGVPEDMFNITVSHIPQLWSSIIACGRGDLTLAGHVHGMQAKLRIGSYEWSPAKLFYKEWSGLYERDGHKLYINDGIGYVGMFIRAGVRPEVTVITLKCSEKGQNSLKGIKKRSKIPF
ncbi:MAG: metallophosphoesterase [Alistipes sp.]|nr:metallophosphoesterase [Alistipes sp.]